MAWLLIELDKRPECLERLLVEIDSSDTGDFRTVNSKMPYLDAVITEVNRLHPPIASTFRTVNREVSITSRKSQYTLQPGMLVFLALGAANRSTNDWGSEADRFMPEKWLEKKGGGYSHLGFGYGSRSCVGPSMCAFILRSNAYQVGYKSALLGTKMFLLELLQTYEIVLRDHDYKVSPGEILGVEKPLFVELYRRRRKQ